MVDKEGPMFQSKKMVACSLSNTMYSGHTQLNILVELPQLNVTISFLDDPSMILPCFVGLMIQFPRQSPNFKGTD